MHVSYPDLISLGERVLVAAVVFVIATILVSILRYTMYNIFDLDLLRTQIIETVSRMAIILSCVYIVLGEAVARTLLGGFSIGIGYALQPLWLGAFNVLWIKSENRHILSRGKMIRFSGKEYIVCEAGLFHVTVTNTSRTETMFISNSKLSENITVIDKCNDEQPHNSINAAPSAIKFS